MNILSHWFQKRTSALAAAEVAREQQSRYNALLGCDIDRMIAAVTSFNAGNLAPLAKVIEEYEMRDDKMKVCSMKMKASVGRCDYTILPREGFEDDPRTMRHIEILKRFWSGITATSRFNQNERGGIALLKKQMMDAQSFGYAVHELVWRPLPNGELTCEFIKIPLWHFENRTGSLRFLKTTADYYGDPLKPGEWLVTTGDGVGIAAAICANLKRACLSDWAVFCERCGMPLIVGKTGAAFGSEQWNNLNDALAAIGRDARIQVDTGTDISALSTGGSASQPYSPLVDWADRAIAALYRGADLSTISAGDATGASLQGDESQMLEHDACVRLSETLHEQVDKFVIRYVTGGEEALATISIEPVKHPDTNANIAIDKHLVDLGVKLSKSDALQRYGRTEAVDPSDELKAPVPVSPGLFNEASPDPSKPAPANGSAATGSPSMGSAATGPAAPALAALAADLNPASNAIKEFLKAPSKEAAEKLIADLPSLLPADPALAAVIAEEMAKEFGEVEEAKPKDEGDEITQEDTETIYKEMMTK